MAQSVVVAGDLISHENLVQHLAKDSAHAARPLITTHSRLGGARRLAALVQIACADVDIAMHEPQDGAGGSRSYALWTLHERAAGSRDRVWRIRELLGAQPDGAAASPAPGAGAQEPNPDLLVLDDQNLGFRNDPARWSAALREGGKPGRIILKTCAPLGEGLLWKKLLGSHADCLDVIVAASDLRDRGASISESLSWDRTIEQTVAEFETGISAGDLALVRRVVVYLGSAGAAVFSRLGARGNSTNLIERVRVQRFLYHPEDQESDWENRHSGLTQDDSAILAAAVVRHEIAPASYPLYIGLGRGLAAMRASREVGGGPAGDFSLETADSAVAGTFHPADGHEPAAAYFTAFPHDLLHEPELKAQLSSESNLLRDAIGSRLDYVLAKGIDICLRGLDAALPPVPKCRYGHYLTVDRDEIERLNAIRNLIAAYRGNLHEHRPLSFAVFGPPGCGKSFAVKELAAELFAGALSIFEFNLSEFERVEDLHQAFHKIRDGSVHGQVPFVFWDEFDTLNLKWLKEFLAPMQDAFFRSNGIQFPFGRVVFVFAGGTASTLAEFEHSAPDDPRNAEFRNAKGPDFVSRLRGFIDIKGPNPAGAKKSGDLSHIIRRAIMLRSAATRLYPQLADAQTGTLSISINVIRAFLLAENYLHGARSLEAIVSMSNLGHAAHFGPAELPSSDLLRLHVSTDFQQHLREAQLELPVIEALAAACHESFCQERERQGYKYGAVRDDDAKTHPLLKPYDQLSEPDKERNRETARLTDAKLSAIGYRIVRAAAGKQAPAVTCLPPEQEAELMRQEHNLWLREHLLQGYEWAEKTQDALRLHRDIVSYDQLTAAERALDASPIRNILENLVRYGYILVNDAPASR